MDVKEAIAKAKAYVADVYGSENIADPELEETEYRNGEWRITVSFARPRAGTWPASPSPQDIVALVTAGTRRRMHKVIIIDENDSVVAMKDRAWMERAE